MKWLLPLLLPFMMGTTSIENPAELNEYVTEFYAAFPKATKINVIILHRNNFPIVTDPLTRTNRLAHGICYVGLAKINRTFWHNSNEWQKRKVVFHELAHCALDLGHTENPFAFSIMNRVLWTVDDKGKNWSILVKELKTRALKQ